MTLGSEVGVGPELQPFRRLVSLRSLRMEDELINYTVSYEGWSKKGKKRINGSVGDTDSLSVQ